MTKLVKRKWNPNSGFQKGHKHHPSSKPGAYSRRPPEAKEFTPTPKELIDAEPARPKQQRFRVGAQCWYVSDTGRWFLCVVESRRRGHLTLRCDTGWDDKHEAEWPFGAGPVEISSTSQAFKRVRKLKDRIA